MPVSSRPPIKPAELLKTNTQLLYIVPHGILHYLPFCALVSKDGRYLLEDFEIAYSPSASAIHYAKQKNTGKKERILAMAPFAGSPEKEGGLANSEREAQKVCGLYKENHLFIGNNATKEIALRLSCKVDHILYSTHGKLMFDNPLDSFLLFAEGERLRVREVFDMDLNAALVVLSACETGLVGVEEAGWSLGDDLVELSRAFIYAGTPSVVGTLWVVDDEHTANVVIKFHENLKSGMSKSRSLKEAQVDLLRHKDEPCRHPFFWAPFVLIGDYV